MNEESKNILILTPRLPYPVVGGDKLRIYKICEYLKKQGHSLTLLSFVENEEQQKTAYSDPKKSIFDEVATTKLTKLRSYINTFISLLGDTPLQISYYKSHQMQELVDSKVNSGRFDTVLVHLARMAPYVSDSLVLNKVLEMTDAISLNYKRNKEAGAKGLKGIIYRLEEERIRNYEMECIQRFDSTVLVSEIDKKYFEREFKNVDHSKVHVISNGVSDEFLNVENSQYNQNKLIFIGNLRSHQNEDAILYFINNIYPIIKKQKPEVSLKIIGANPSEKLKKYNGKNNIEVTGRVGSIIEHAHRAAVSVAPIRIGAGVQNKVLESMAMGIPVVTTQVGAEGIDEIEHEESIMIAENSTDFASHVIELLNKKELRNKLSSHGKSIIKRNYAWDTKLKEYLEII